jgi:8-oxo-dGTP diphosphatase
VLDDGSLRRWEVAGGVIVDHRGVLLVANRRRNGVIDWSTPGGVIDSGESPLQALTREVHEETGLSVLEWSERLYEVEVVAPDLGFHLTVHAYRAQVFRGEIVVDDPDGIVVDARWVALTGASARLQGSSPWVVEPLLDYLNRQPEHDQLFRYRLLGCSRSERRVLRLHSG